MALSKIPSAFDTITNLLQRGSPSFATQGINTDAGNASDITDDLSARFATILRGRHHTDDTYLAEVKSSVDTILSFLSTLAFDLPAAGIFTSGAINFSNRIFSRFFPSKNNKTKELIKKIGSRVDAAIEAEAIAEARSGIDVAANVINQHYRNENVQIPLNRRTRIEQARINLGSNASASELREEEEKLRNTLLEFRKSLTDLHSPNSSLRNALQSLQTDRAPVNEVPFVHRAFSVWVHGVNTHITVLKILAILDTASSSKTDIRWLDSTYINDLVYYMEIYLGHLTTIYGGIRDTIANRLAKTSEGRSRVYRNRYVIDTGLSRTAHIHIGARNPSGPQRNLQGFPSGESVRSIVEWRSALTELLARQHHYLPGYLRKLYLSWYNAYTTFLAHAEKKKEVAASSTTS